MVSARTWERIERRQVRGRERQSHQHSFDNYLGTLGRGDGLPVGDDGLPDAENPDSSGAMIRAYHASSTEQDAGVPCQSWSASHAQWADGKLDGFVTATEEAAPDGDKSAAMGYWTERDLPAVGDRQRADGRPAVQPA